MNLCERSGQQGATLFMTLIMLVVLTLFVVSAITMSTSNLRVVGNMQAQIEAEAAAQQAITKFISVAANFNPAPTTNTVFNIDINSDNITDYVVTLKPPALRGVAQLGGSSYSISGNMNTWWELTACVVPTASNVLGTAVVVATHEGVRVPLPTSAVPTTTPVPPQSCP